MSLAGAQRHEARNRSIGPIAAGNGRSAALLIDCASCSSFLLEHDLFRKRGSASWVRAAAASLHCAGSSLADSIVNASAGILEGADGPEAINPRAWGGLAVAKIRPMDFGLHVKFKE